MSSNWPTVKLGDFCKKIGSGATPRGGASVYMDDGEICLIRSQNVHNEGFNPNGLVYIDEDAAKKLSNVIVEENDVLLNITGDSVARVCLAKSRFLPARVNQHVAIIRPDEDEFDPRFIRYLLASPTYQNILLSIAAVGATRNALTKGMIENLDVLKPPIEQQIEMANQLEALDKKIDINSETNQTLEQIAQAIFKSWFVDFDPVKAKIETLAAGGSADDAELAAMSVISAKTIDELNSLKTSNPEAFNKLAQTAALFPKDLDNETGTPAGWNSGVIADIAKLNANSWTKKNRPEQVHYVDLSNTKNGRIETVTTYGFDEAPSRARRILNSGDTIIGTVRPGNRAFAFIGETEKPLTGSTGFAVLSPKEEFWTSFVYLATTNDDAIDEYARLADGGAYPAIKPEVVADTPCVLPTKDIAQKFWQLTGAMLKKAHQARLENEELAKTRDTLLPKLLSGEINVTSEVVE
ncbi:restriction endonuclease subunit S [Vibrio vulnificus]|nr:restriction endonuclease subunit S [Vibrio vulnificus]